MDLPRGEVALGAPDAPVDHGVPVPAELCSRCGGGALQRLQRRFWEYPLSLLHIWPFRCKDCQSRLLKFSQNSFK